MQVGPRVGTDWVITSGLKAGEKVIVEGIQKVKSGVPVVAKRWTPTAERSAPVVETNPAAQAQGAPKLQEQAPPFNPKDLPGWKENQNAAGSTTQNL